MAVEAPNITLFPSQLITNRIFSGTNQLNSHIFDTQMGSSLAFDEPLMPYSTTSALLPLYQSLACDPILAKSSDKFDSNPRKRLRDSINDFDASIISFPVGEEDILFQIHHHQSEIDQFLAEHTQKQSKMLVTAIEGGVNKKLKEKDEEIQRMGKMNWVLQERVKSLYFENQIWREITQTNEAKANSLRTNLEQVLAHFTEGDRHATASAVADDAESSCGSTLAGEEVDGGSGRRCKRCGEREASVVLIPCRHLCLCTICGSTLLGNCPVCDSGMTGSVHVNLS